MVFLYDDYGNIYSPINNGSQIVTFQCITTGYGYGSDKLYYALAMNDVDFCLKVVEKPLPSTYTFTETLSSGSTSVTFTNDNIDTDSYIEVYTSEFGVDPTNITFTSPNTITVTFEEQPDTIDVGLVVSNS